MPDEPDIEAPSLPAPAASARLTRRGRYASLPLVLCSVVAFACFVGGVAAWVMGRGDLAEIVMVTAFIDALILTGRPQVIYAARSVSALLVLVGGSFVCLIAGFACASVVLLGG